MRPARWPGALADRRPALAVLAGAALLAVSLSAQEPTRPADHFALPDATPPFAPRPAPTRFLYAGDSEFPPFESLGEDGQPTGFLIALIRRIGEVTNTPVEIRLGARRDAIEGLLAGNADFAALAYSDDREDQFGWLDRVWTVNQSFVFKSNRPTYPRDLDELTEEVVVVQDHSVAHEMLAAMRPERRPTIVLEPSQERALDALVEGRASVAIGNGLTLRVTAERLRVRDIVFQTLRSRPFRFATRPGGEARMAWVSGGLELIRQSGEFDRLVEEYLVVSPDTQLWRRFLVYGGWLVAIVLVVVGAIVRWNRALRRQVIERQATVDRTSRLQTVTASLAEALSTDDVAAVIEQQGLISLKAQAGVVAFYQQDVLSVVHASGGPAASYAALRDGVLEPGGPMMRAARTNALVLSSPPTLKERLTPFVNQSAVVAYTAIPLSVGARCLGVLGLGFDDERGFSADDQALMLVLGRQSGLALERAHLYEAERSARAEAEAASRAKDEFLATLSHELRTPLNAILGWTHMLRNGMLEGEKSSRALETIERNARVQMQLIADLLDVSRAFMGNLRLERTPVDLAYCLDAALDAVRPVADTKGIHLRTAIASNGSRIVGDAARVQQIFWNLLSNAIKFTPAGGVVDVTFGIEKSRSGGTGERHRRRHRPVRSPARVRSLLSGRCLDDACTRRTRSGPRHRPSSGRSARRRGDG